MLNRGLKIKIVPENIENVFETTIVKIDDENYYFDLQNNVMCKNESFDGYAFSDNGIIFLSANVKDIKDNLVSFSKDTDCQLLQRRQYERLKIDNDVVIKDLKNNIQTPAWLIDLSVGGFKMHVKTPVDINKRYILTLNLNQKDIDLEFQPISLIKDMENLYTISARFENISNSNKITLVQFCYKKQAEKIDE